MYKGILHSHNFEAKKTFGFFQAQHNEAIARKDLLNYDELCSHI